MAKPQPTALAIAQAQVEKLRRANVTRILLNELAALSRPTFYGTTPTLDAKDLEIERLVVEYEGETDRRGYGLMLAAGTAKVDLPTVIMSAWNLLRAYDDGSIVYQEDRDMKRPPHIARRRVAIEQLIEDGTITVADVCAYAKRIDAARKAA